jgi:hypothetical protein
VRVIDVFVDELDLQGLGFEGVVPEATGRPAYHPVTMLKIYVYGYINQIQSSRRLERATARNVEMMWLTGRLTSDFKTIDGSRFKAVNSRDRSFSRGSIKRRMEQVEASIDRYLSALKTADREARRVGGSQVGAAEGQDRHGSREQMRKLKALEAAVHAAPDKQISLTDPDARSMATSGKDTGLVGYNVQAVVDAQHPLIVAHEVTNIGNDRSQLSTMARQAQEATGVSDLTANRRPRLLQGRRDSGLRGGGRDAARSDAADLNRQSGRPVRQAGFRLRCGARTFIVVLPGRR